MLHVQLFDEFYGHWHGPEGGPFLPVQSAVSSHPIGPIEVTEISVLGHIRSQQAGQFFEPTAMLVALSEIRQFICYCIGPFMITSPFKVFLSELFYADVAALLRNRHKTGVQSIIDFALHCSRAFCVPGSGGGVLHIAILVELYVPDISPFVEVRLA